MFQYFFSDNHVQVLHKKLMYENSHHKCVLQMKDEEIIKLREELLTLGIKNKIDPGVVAEREKKLQTEIKLNKQQILVVIIFDVYHCCVPS